MKILDKLDSFFEAQKDTEQKITFMATIIVIFFISYYFIYPLTDEVYKNTLNQNKRLNREINSKQFTIARLKNSIIKTKKEEKALQIKIKELTKAEIVMHNLLHKVQFLIFSLNRWANIYNKIPRYVNNSNLLLLQLDNKLFLDDKSKINKLVNLKMQITLKVVGDFKNLVKLINIFESRKDLVKIVSLQTDGVVTSLTINIYGAEL